MTIKRNEILGLPLNYTGEKSPDPDGNTWEEVVTWGTAVALNNTKVKVRPVQLWIDNDNGQLAATTEYAGIIIGRGARNLQSPNSRKARDAAQLPRLPKNRKPRAVSAWNLFPVDALLNHVVRRDQLDARTATTVRQ